MPETVPGEPKSRPPLDDLKMTTVSAILATYNGESYVGETLQSLLAQSRPPEEIVVCDDGSKDGTVELLHSFGAPVQVVVQENAGVSAARNRAASLATGDVLAFVDQDDLWEPERLELQVRQLEERPELGLVYADSWIIDGEGTVKGRRREHLDYAEGHVFAELCEGNFIPIETLSIPTRIYRAIGGFDEQVRYVEDWEICLRIARTHPIGFHPEPLGRYRIHGENLSYNMEAILGEYASILEELPRRMPDLTDAERTQVASVLRRRCGELAWYAVKRRDREQTVHWLAKARPVRPRSLGAKIAFFRALLGALPAPLAERAGHALERRGLFGSVRSS
jgi:glycosyltransferase involved in cell wall biosynthesis